MHYFGIKGRKCLLEGGSDHLGKCCCQDGELPTEPGNVKNSAPGGHSSESVCKQC